MKRSCLEQAQQISGIVFAADLRIGYFPAHFIVRKDESCYIDYECNNNAD